MKIVILDGYTTNPGDISWAELEALGDLTVYERTQPEEVAARIDGVEIVLTNKTPLTRECIASAKALRYIGVLATGYNVVDVDAASKRGIPVTNVPSYASTSVAQLVFAHILEICHHVGHHDATIRQGKWSESIDFCYWDYPLVELTGKRMGIIGFGRIGQATARLARAFGMKVLTYDTWPDKSSLESGMRMVPLEELYESSDIVSLHCPLLPTNKGMIDAKSIAHMKDGVWIINTSRGPLVNEADICAALKSGKVGYYAADVVSSEPIAADNPLLTAPNTLLTPHIAWAPRAARVRLVETVARNLQVFLAGKAINVVNL